MCVFEIRLKIFLLKDIKINKLQSTIASFIDKSLAKKKEFLELHYRNEFKNYCFDGMYPLSDNGIYNSNNIYTITIRTIDKKLADYFNENISNEFDSNIKGLVSELRILPRKYIDKIYSITPVIVKTESGYWKGKLTVEEYEKRLRENLFKKYKMINNASIDEKIEIYNSIEFINKKPIGCLFKNIELLGDKIALKIADDKLSQELAYMSLGTGVLEMNSRGYGFMNYRWL
ncbi:CRISPR-associated endoribonuclease Cas6 [Clostridium sp.]|uniref:CRISPR-associated endoribonuclease Cas6 n=1 Tax=Clostridium sp. TaxID=1506 RepID=UPI0025C64473|nr:CRISPR-associated endoribonuclease Cas6 [Clostridium sp.]